MTPSLLRWPEPEQILNQVRHGAAQVAAVLDQAALQIQREREASQPRTPLLLLPELLRNALASLALPSALPPWPGVLAAISRSCRSCRAPGGVPGLAAQAGAPVLPMPITSASSAAGIAIPAVTTNESPSLDTAGGKATVLQLNYP